MNSDLTKTEIEESLKLGIFYAKKDNFVQIYYKDDQWILFDCTGEDTPKFVKEFFFDQEKIDFYIEPLRGKSLENFMKDCTMSNVTINNKNYIVLLETIFYKMKDVQEISLPEFLYEYFRYMTPEITPLSDKDIYDMYTVPFDIVIRSIFETGDDYIPDSLDNIFYKDILKLYDRGCEKFYSFKKILRYFRDQEQPCKRALEGLRYYLTLRFYRQEVRIKDRITIYINSSMGYLEYYFHLFKIEPDFYDEELLELLIMFSPEEDVTLLRSTLLPSILKFGTIASDHGWC